MRLDLFLVDRKFASSRTKAQDLIRSGKVLVNGTVCTKAGEKISPENQVQLLEAEHPFVSRGGVKLESALEHFSISVKGARALDVGQSTGGFTHCLLLKGADEVVGVEVGHGQLAAEIAANPKVKSFEHSDIRTISPETLGGAFSHCVVDLSFISLRLILPGLHRFLQPQAHVILLVKPQFEVGPDSVGSGGIVRDPERRSAAVREVEKVAHACGFTVAGVFTSPLQGGDGNQEIFLYLRTP